MPNREKFAARQPNIIREDAYKQYAVLIPMLNTSEGIHLLFEKRSAKLRRQPGEVCFPGGKREQGESARACAIRETMEELLVQQNQIEVLGPGDIYLSPFGLILHPYIGILKDYQNTYSTDEVAEVISIPLEFFRNEEPRSYTNDLVSRPPDDFPYEWIPGGDKYPWAQGSYDILFYKYDEHIIWGMTAQILKSVVDLIDQYELAGYVL